jgi:DNA-binding PucR family transcriptional regulator
MFELFRFVHEDELEGTPRPNGSSRLNAVSRALRGLWVDPDELGYDLANSHIALIADSSSLLDALAEHTGRQILHVPAPVDGVWGWLGGRSRLSEAELDELLAWQRSRDGRVAFGEPAEGIAGFSASHHQALETRDIANATGDGVVRFADVRLLIAVLRDSQLARGFIERELGELDHPSKRMKELRATLRVYLEQGQSVSTTAALRQRNRKTIQRQLQAAEQLIHHDVRDRSDDLLVAMRASEVLQRRNR